ncbi:hypothetical protein K7X08_013445 [Anisodus acutangulus]|uniref:Peptidase S59 domain-containing protein n=1 Tax=Anisodus acutangulus TaxID=402998 RepID=A0A9Q1REG7_9SOLA|nr:hypothetical protein K7X08_013445 [Anisodus acutangulus]
MLQNLKNEMGIMRGYFLTRNFFLSRNEIVANFKCLNLPIITGKIAEVVCVPENGSSPKDKDNDLVENGFDKEGLHSAKMNQKPNDLLEGQHLQKGGSSITLAGHRAAKERAEPGFCGRVKDFVVGRHGYGSIKFMGETDVRRLDLESLIQFNNREVIVYMDGSKKPPVGQGLNKPAEVILLNIKCFDKKTGQHYEEGPRIEKYKDMLKRKAGDQGAEFVSYDPIKGEWKFRVQHFSKYRLQEDNEDGCGEYCSLWQFCDAKRQEES